MLKIKHKKNCNVTKIFVARFAITVMAMNLLSLSFTRNLADWCIFITTNILSETRLHFLVLPALAVRSATQYMVCRNEYSDFISCTDVVRIPWRRHTSWLKSRSVDMQLTLQMPSVEKFDVPTNCYISDSTRHLLAFYVNCSSTSEVLREYLCTYKLCVCVHNFFTKGT